MKLLLVLIFMFTQGSVLAKTGESKLKDTETNNYLASAKAKDLEDQLSQSEIFLECKENAANDTIKKVEACIQGKFSQINVDEFADKTDLKSFDINASKNSTSIRKYLSERLSNALYGEAKKGKLKKLVDHEVYSKLYRSQIGKNILVEVSNYCISNLGFEDTPYKIVNHCYMQEDENGKKQIDSSCEIDKSITSTTTTPEEFGTALYGIDSKKDVVKTYAIEFNSGEGYEDKLVNNRNIRTFNADKFKVSDVTSIYMRPKNSTTTTIWEQLYEYDLNESCAITVSRANGTNTVLSPTNPHTTQGYCAIKKTDTSGNIVYQRIRNNSYITAVKELEFKLGASYMRNKYKFCAFSAVKNMCEVYRCRNIYQGVNASSDALSEYSKKCDPLGIDDYKTRTDTTAHTNNNSGMKACSLMAKLKQYRKNIQALDEIDKHNKGLRKNTGLSSSMYQGGFYQGKNSGSEKSIEKLTTISSTELAGKKSEAEIGMSEDEIKELRDECIASDGSLAAEEKCQKLVSDLDEKNAKDVSADLESETQLYLKKIDELEDPETIKEYLLKHGLSRYISEVESNPDLLKKLIQDEYKSERDALKKSMMDKFNRLTKKDNGSGAPPAPGADTFESDKAALAVESIENIEKKKETIQTLFQYNNVISSYMSAQIGKGDNAKSTELSYQRDIELEGMNKFGDETEQEKYESYSEILKDENARKGGDGEQLDVDIKFIDTLLGNPAPKKE